MQDAEDHLEIVEDTKARLEQEQRTAEMRLSVMEVNLNDAHRAALRADPATQRLLEDFVTAQRTCAELRHSLEVVDASGGLTDRFWVSERQWPEPAAAHAWQAAVAALRTNADAELPQ
jgi:hypothetical protein